MSYPTQKRITPEKKIVLPEVTKWAYVEVDYGIDFRPSLKKMADAVESLNLWDWFRHEKPPPKKGYMFWQHANINLLVNKMDIHMDNIELGCALRAMQHIAKNGFASWNKMVLENKFMHNP